MSTGIIPIIKKAALDAVDNSKMCDLRYGTVVSVSPLKVQITTQFFIPESLLIVPQHLTKYTVECMISDKTEQSTDLNGEFKQTITINNSLKVGDKVALLRKQGGQSYFILDRI